jgi:hypothetical protein
MDECDVCGKPADLTCSKCFQAVYCSVGCQTADHPEHSECECFHPTEMTREQLEFEIGLEMNDQPYVDSNIMDNQEKSIQFLIGLLNKYRTKRKYKSVRKQRRIVRKKKNRDNRSYRTAKKGVKQERLLESDKKNGLIVKQRKQNAQREFGTRF